VKEKTQEKEQIKEKEQEKEKGQEIFPIAPLISPPSDSTPEFIISTPKKDDKENGIIIPAQVPKLPLNPSETIIIEKIVEKKNEDTITLPLTPTDTFFRDISESDPSYQILKDFLQLAVKLGNLKIPENKIFRPKNKTRWLFALQMALAIRGESCGSGRGNLRTQCMTKATELGFIDEKGFIDKTITKGDFYELILLAGKFSSVEPRAELLCDDVDRKHPYANIIATANYYGLVRHYASKGKTNLCFPGAPLTKVDAATLAAKAQKAK
jgi:hypothetical protein